MLAHGAEMRLCCLLYQMVIRDNTIIEDIDTEQKEKKGSQAQRLARVVIEPLWLVYGR